MAESTLVGHVSIRDRYKEEVELGRSDDELLEWLEREAAANELGGFRALTPDEQTWVLGKIHNFLG